MNKMSGVMWRVGLDEEDFRERMELLIEIIQGGIDSGNLGLYHKQWHLVRLLQQEIWDIVDSWRSLGLPPLDDTWEQRR